MRELTGDLWEVEADARAITTNGFVKTNGRAVMGRGVAAQALQRFPDINWTLGRLIAANGNHVGMLGWAGDLRSWLLSFPVKHHWRQMADLALIERSARELIWVADECKFNTVVLPRPGCGNGGLRWEDVKPVIEPLLDDRFVVVER